MSGGGILNKMKDKVISGFVSTAADNTGKGKSKIYGKHIKHGFHMVKGKSHHDMEDYVVAQFRNVNDKELGLFAIFDGHLGYNVADYLQSHLFDNILKQTEFWTDPRTAIRKAYKITDKHILEKAADLGRGGSTAVTAILVGGERLIVGNVGDSRAVLCKSGDAIQLSIDHEPVNERRSIERKGGFVTRVPGDVPRVDGRLAVARAFGDRSLKRHLSSDPDVVEALIDSESEFLILASDGLWTVVSNQEATDAIRSIKDAQAAAKHLVDLALARKSRDDISCIVVTFH